MYMKYRYLKSGHISYAKKHRKGISAETTTEVNVLAENWKYIIGGLTCQMRLSGLIGSVKQADCCPLHAFIFSGLANGVFIFPFRSYISNVAAMAPYYCSISLFHVISPPPVSHKWGAIIVSCWGCFHGCTMAEIQNARESIRRWTDTISTGLEDKDMMFCIQPDGVVMVCTLVLWFALLGLMVLRWRCDGLHSGIFFFFKVLWFALLGLMVLRWRCDGLHSGIFFFFKVLWFALLGLMVLRWRCDGLHSGELMEFYRFTPIAVIGGSFFLGLTDHNISEAAIGGSFKATFFHVNVFFSCAITNVKAPHLHLSAFLDLQK
ncbi:hypothetical protein L2E82_29651 [Cichorium intybus]|uniref:Uncharacterized protein n=1 Tax=Cichorium intybus TaxID=13427 RepID=A0ACB9CY43_CICIN|nr:hypothetical protein L2E82_29651 [Cichorium intybus]